jgi:hypothetical protein
MAIRFSVKVNEGRRPRSAGVLRWRGWWTFGILLAVCFIYPIGAVPLLTQAGRPVAYVGSPVCGFSGASSGTKRSIVRP